MKTVIRALFALLLIPAIASAEVEMRRQRAVATKYVIGIRNSSTGALISAAAGLDTECTKWDEGGTPGTPADVTNEATELGSTGLYHVALTGSASGETDADYILCQTKSSTTNAMTAVVFINTKYGTVKVNSSGNLDTGTIDAATIAADSIGASELAADAIGASELATDAIGAAEIAADAIGASELATDAIGAAELAANAIAAAEIADGAIDAATFAAGAIDAAAIAADAIGASELAANAVGSAELANGALTAAKFGYDGDLASESGTTLGLATGGVTADDQYNNGFAIVLFDATTFLAVAKSCIVDSVNAGDTVVTAEDISAFTAVGNKYTISSDSGCASRVGTGGITSSSFAAGAIDATAIAADAIGASELATDAIGAAEIAANAIAAAEIANGAIDAATFAAGAIDAAAVADGAIDAATFAAGAIDAAAIAADAIGASELAASAIGASEIGADAITAAKIATDAITADELSTGALAEFITTNTGTTSASAVEGSVAKETADLVGSVSCPTAAQNADAVWDESRSGHTSAGTFGLYLDQQVSTVSGGGGGSCAVRRE